MTPYEIDKLVLAKLGIDESTKNKIISGVYEVELSVKIADKTPLEALIERSGYILNALMLADAFSCDVSEIQNMINDRTHGIHMIVSNLNNVKLNYFQIPSVRYKLIRILEDVGLTQKHVADILRVPLKSIQHYKDYFICGGSDKNKFTQVVPICELTKSKGVVKLDYANLGLRMIKPTVRLDDTVLNSSEYTVTGNVLTLLKDYSNYNELLILDDFILDQDTVSTIFE
ncbi:MAG: hypothetical protein ACRC92_18720 [Peptostreptococcaceae bacterium]